MRLPPFSPRRATIRVMRYTALVLVGLLLSSSSIAVSAADDGAVAKEIERLEQQLVTAIEAKDFATYQKLVAEDYVAVGAAGETTRTQAMETYRTGALSLPGLKIGEVKVHVYGDTAMISARTFGDRVENGKTTPNRVRYMRIWMKRDGAWRAVAQMARPL